MGARPDPINGPASSDPLRAWRQEKWHACGDNCTGHPGRAGVLGGIRDGRRCKNLRRPATTIASSPQTRRAAPLPSDQTVRPSAARQPVAASPGSSRASRAGRAAPLRCPDARRRSKSARRPAPIPTRSASLASSRSTPPAARLRLRALQVATISCTPGEVVLTFDDGPWLNNTPMVLKALADQCVKATFFPIGKHATYYPEILKQVAAAGHTIGSHTWSHAESVEEDRSRKPRKRSRRASAR